MPRLATLSVLALLAVVASGCVSIKSEAAFQRLPGFVTRRLDLCVSDRNGSTYADCVPGTNTAEDDNGLDGDDESGRGQLLVGFRVPWARGAPASFVSSDGSATFAQRELRRAASGRLRRSGRLPPGGLQLDRAAIRPCAPRRRHHAARA